MSGLMTHQGTGTPEVTPPSQSDAVAAVFARFPQPQQDILFDLRRIIFEPAAEDPDIGRLTETLKWGQPAYLTEESRSGTTIRLGIGNTGSIALYTHCQTTVISDFQTLFPEAFTYEGNRAVHLDPAATLPEDHLSALIRSALRYKIAARDSSRQ